MFLFCLGLCVNNYFQFSGFFISSLNIFIQNRMYLSVNCHNSLTIINEVH